MERVRVLDSKRIVFPLLMFIISLTFPFWIYGANGRFELSSILLGISIDMSEPSALVRFIPDSRLLLPALLICVPCFIWLFMERDLKFSGRLISASLLTVLMIAMLSQFLPVWAVFPWLFPVVIAVVPDYINLIPFSGLAFTTMILLPMIWRVLTYSETEVRPPRMRLAAGVLTITSILLPSTVEISSWYSTDYARSFFEGFSLDAVTWSLSNRVDGNRWGQNTWVNFSVSSIFSCLSLILLMLPGIVFAWFALRYASERKRIPQMLATGLIHFLVLVGACIWWNYTASYPGSWVIMPFPALLIVGLLIFAVYYIYQKRSAEEVQNQTKPLWNSQRSEY